MTASPVLCDAYCIEYICWAHHTYREFLIKWVWLNLSDKHHPTVPKLMIDNHIEKQVE